MNSKSSETSDPEFGILQPTVVLSGVNWSKAILQAGNFSDCSCRKARQICRAVVQWLNDDVEARSFLSL